MRENQTVTERSFSPTIIRKWTLFFISLREKNFKALVFVSHELWWHHKHLWHCVCLCEIAKNPNLHNQIKYLIENYSTKSDDWSASADRSYWRLWNSAVFGIRMKMEVADTFKVLIKIDYRSVVTTMDEWIELFPAIIL